MTIWQKSAEESDRFIFHRRFENGQSVMVILENEKERRRYYVPTTKHAFSSICVGTFSEHDERMYETGICVECH